jgi:hypothetical protein
MAAAAMALAPLALAVVGVGCGDAARIPPRLYVQAEAIAAVDAPSGWTAFVPGELNDDQFVTEVDGVPLLFFTGGAAGGDRSRGQAVSAGAAWQSPAVAVGARAEVCAEAVAYARRAGDDGVLGVESCLDTFERTDLRPGFVVPFGSRVDELDEPVGDVRSLTGGVLLADDGSLTVVVSLAHSLAP